MCVHKELRKRAARQVLCQEKRKKFMNKYIKLKKNWFDLDFQSRFHKYRLSRELKFATNVKIELLLYNKILCKRGWKV